MGKITGGDASPIHAKKAVNPPAANERPGASHDPKPKASGGTGGAAADQYATEVINSFFAQAGANPEKRRQLEALSRDVPGAREYLESDQWKNNEVDAFERAFFERHFRSSGRDPEAWRAVWKKLTAPEAEPLYELLLQTVDETSTHPNLGGNKSAELWAEFVPFLISLEAELDPEGIIRGPVLNMLSGAGGREPGPGLDLSTNYMDGMVTSAEKVGFNSVVCMETDGWFEDMIYAAKESYFLENLDGDTRVDNVIARLPRQGEASLSGYSYGAVVAARAAVKYLEDNPEAKLDSLVLIGSPVVRDSELDVALHALREQGRIDKLIAADIAGDPFSSPYFYLLPVADLAGQVLTMQGDAPHFSFAHDTKKSDLLRAKLWGSVAAAMADMEEAKKSRAESDESGLFRRVVIHPEVWKEESHDLEP